MGTVLSLFRPKEQDSAGQLEGIEKQMKVQFEKRIQTIRLKDALYKKTRNYG